MVYHYRMPNQQDIMYNALRWNIEDGILHITQGNISPYSELPYIAESESESEPTWIGPISKYRFVLKFYINSYIEGPLGCYDNEGTPHSDMWRLVLTFMRNIDGTLCKTDAVLSIKGADKTALVLQQLTDCLSC